DPGRGRDVARTHGLGRLDVLLDDGPEYRGFPLVQHLALKSTECQFTEPSLPSAKRLRRRRRHLKTLPTPGPAPGRRPRSRHRANDNGASVVVEPQGADEGLLGDLHPTDR